jgi:DNA-binding transcriptional LysR family regulator
MHFQAYLSGFGVSPYVLMDNHYATTMPSFAAALHGRHFDLVARRLPKPLRPLVFRMVWTRRQDSSAIHRWVRQAILAVINDYIAGGALTAPHMPEAVG